MLTVLIVLHVLLAAALIAVVLVQRGPGATMGAAFGAGASGTVFGSRGAGNFLTHLTAWLAAGFFVISLSMAVLAARNNAAMRTADDSLVATQAQPASEDAAESVLQALELEGEQAAGDAEAATTEEAAGEPAASEDDGEEIPEPPVD
ncbi:MAG: preprotein translocase subunit SecG [Wenzhouxiangellaceae bacterium]|nr:preprotein translocase subunit SecG [Wenzhouxiangellaceae bacterium]